MQIKLSFKIEPLFDATLFVASTAYERGKKLEINSSNRGIWSRGTSRPLSRS
mgnify:CR=1 FL=1